MKKSLICIICVFTIFTTNIWANAHETIQAYLADFIVRVDGENTDLHENLVVINDQTYVPMRELCENIGVGVSWDETSKIVSLTNCRADNTLYPYKSGDLYGYIDRFGRVIIEPTFDYAGDFSEGLACVGKWLEPSQNGSYTTTMLYGYINTSGSVVIPFSSDRARDFQENFVPAWEPETGKCYVMDRTGNDIFGKNYFDMKGFSDGYAAVLLNDTAFQPNKKPNDEFQQWTFINTKGEECGIIYNMVTPFIGGISIVEQDGVRKAINTSFETVFQSEYEILSYNGEGQYIVREPESGKFGVIDKNGIIIEPKYASIRYSDGMYKVGINANAFGFINKYGQVVLEPKQNQHVLDFKSGLSVFGDHNSVIDKNGNILLIADEFDVVAPQTENLLYVFKQENGKSYEGYIDIYGNVLIMNETNS